MTTDRDSETLPAPANDDLGLEPIRAILRADYPTLSRAIVCESLADTLQDAPRDVDAIIYQGCTVLAYADDVALDWVITPDGLQELAREAIHAIRKDSERVVETVEPFGFLGLSRAS